MNEIERLRGELESQGRASRDQAPAPTEDATRPVDIDAPTEDRPTMLALQASAGNAAVLRLMRRTGRAPLLTRKTATESVGGGTGSVQIVPGFDRDPNATFAPGDQGYTEHAMHESAAGPAAAAHAGSYGDALLSPVTVPLDPIRSDQKTRAQEKTQADIKAESGTPSIKQEWKTRASNAESHGTQLASDMARMQQIERTYNAGVPRANRMFSSLARLEGFQDMLGVADVEGMVNAVCDSLKEAKAIADEGKIKGIIKNIPKVNEKAGKAQDDVTSAQKTMQIAWQEVQALNLNKEAASKKAEGEADQKRLDEINENIKTWEQIGKTIDTGMKVMAAGKGAMGPESSGPIMEPSGGAKMPKSQAEVNEMPVGPPSAPPGGAPVPRPGVVPGGSMSTQSEDKAKELAKELAGGVGVPTDAAGLLKTGAELYYAKEILAIKTKLADLNNTASFLEKAGVLVGAQTKLQNLSKAVEDFERKNKELEDAILARQEEYVAFGKELDEAAQKLPSFRGSGPGAGKERFTTVMLIVSAVREVLSMADGAVAGFGMNGEAVVQETLGFDANRKQRFTGLAQLSMRSSELRALGNIGRQLNGFQANVDRLKGQLGRIEAAAGSLMQGLHGGKAGTGAY